MNFKFNKSSGQASRFLLILAIVILVAVVIVYLVMKMATPAPKPPGPDVTPEIPLPVYENTIDDIRFVFLSARDMGGTLKGSMSRDASWQKDLTTTEKFIILTIGAQNKGKENTPDRAWSVDNIVDSEGREFVALDYNVNSWLPNPNLCGTLLKPEFEPTPCIKIYEVSKISVGLKVRVIASNKNAAGIYSTDKKDETMLDLIVK